MLLDLNGLECAVSVAGESFKKPLSFTVEVYYVPGVGTRTNAVLWVHDKGTKSNSSVGELFVDMTDNLKNIKLDPPI